MEDTSAVAAGRWIGILMLLQFAAGVLAMLVLTAPLFGEAGYLGQVEFHRLTLGFSVLLSLAGAILTIAIAVIAYEPFRARGPRLALAFLLLSGAGAALTAVEQAGILAMLSYAEVWRAADAATRTHLEAVRVTGTLLRNGMHYVGLLMHGVILAYLYGALLRFALLPRLVPAFGLLAVMLQLYAISQPVLGGEVPFALLAPLAIAQLLTGTWLVARGFRR